MGAYIHGVLINTCNILVVWEQINCDLFQAKRFFLSHNQSLPPAAHQSNALETNQSVRGLR